jgi:electron-transferring-flavoprotein dehydrogenase
MNKARDLMEVDVLCIGAGMANLSAVYQLLQTCQKNQTKPPSILVIDKARNIGNHVLGGAIFDPIAFRELFAHLADSELPFMAPVAEDQIAFFTETSRLSVPAVVRPAEMKNRGYYVGSLGEAVRWMQRQCEALGAEIISEFAANELIIEHEKVCGARIADKGLNADGTPSPAYAPGTDVRAKITLLGEGSHGVLSRQLIERFNLNENRNLQNYALGIKEIIKVPKGRLNPGDVLHSFGYPLDAQTYGGGFLYAYDATTVGVGLAVALDYKNPALNPHDLFLRYKRQPHIAQILHGGEVIENGAKTIPEGGWYAIPKLATHGALLVGDSAGMLNAMRLKGAHLAMKSGMLAADKIFTALQSGDLSAEALDYRAAFDVSWAGKEMYKTRNFRQGFHHGLLFGMAFTGAQMITAGKFPCWKMKLPPDHSTLNPIKTPIVTSSQEHDHKLHLDILSDVHKSGTRHREDQPCHCVFEDPTRIQTDHQQYGSPCARFCPAKVYEETFDNEGTFLDIQVNFSNCLHCKTCAIKDPLQNIQWNLPEGGDGPRWQKM